MTMHRRLRNELARYSRLLSERGYSAGTEGNLSVRLPGGGFLVTPTRRVKAFLRPSDMVEIDASGRAVHRGGKPATERFTHLAIYRQAPEAFAVAHAHPLFTVVASALGRNPFAEPFLAEAAMLLANVRFAPFAAPSTEEGAAAVEGLVEGADAIVADRHGAFTWGATVEEAFAKLEVLEKVAKADYLARLAGEEIRFLDPGLIERLSKVKY